MLQGCVAVWLQGCRAEGLQGCRAACPQCCRALRLEVCWAVRLQGLWSLPAHVQMCRYLGSISSSKWVGEGPREGQAPMEMNQNFMKQELHISSLCQIALPASLAPTPYTASLLCESLRPCSLAAIQCPTQHSIRPTTTALLHCGHPALRPHSPAALIHYIPRTPMRSRTGWTFMQQPSSVTHAPRRSIKRGVGGWVEGGGGD